MYPPTNRAGGRGRFALARAKASCRVYRWRRMASVCARAEMGSGGNEGDEGGEGDEEAEVRSERSSYCVVRNA